MALKEYEVTMPGGYVTTMQLSEKDAERLGVNKPQRKAATTKKRLARNKTADAAGDES